MVFDQLFHVTFSWLIPCVCDMQTQTMHVPSNELISQASKCHQTRMVTTTREMIVKYANTTSLKVQKVSLKPKLLVHQTFELL